YASSWDTTYTHDLVTHAQTPSHTGTTWFADARASQKTLSHLLSLRPPLSPTTTTFLDLGTGNGEMLFLLRSEGGFTGPMLGIDYSAASVALAERIAAQKGFGRSEVRFREWDILGGEWEEGEEGIWDVVLDKGTFDAVTLSAETDAEGRRICEGYRAKVLSMVKKGGRFLVTSCNWTGEELRAWFEGRGDGDAHEVGSFEWEGTVRYPSFRFGGLTGQSVSGVCFRRI
ncbi:MAG: hypothetical protein Q9207_005629, partial [Kuettlingeria erythrocarpa]